MQDLCQTYARSTHLQFCLGIIITPRHLRKCLGIYENAGITILPLTCTGLTIEWCWPNRTGMLLISSGQVPDMAARPYSGNFSTLMPLMVNHPAPTPLIPSLSGLRCAPPIHWQISGLDGTTASAIAAVTVTSLFVTMWNSRIQNIS
jgi:hypothetical protein